MSARFFSVTIKEVVAVAGLYFMCDTPYKLKTHKNPVFARNLSFIFLFSKITFMFLGILNDVVSLNVS